MAGGGGEHEAVPDRVLEAQALPDMEDDAGGIEHAADRDQDERDRRQRRRHRPDDEQAAPAHDQIERDRGAVEPAGEDKLERDAGRGRGPLHGEDGVGGRAPHRQHEGGVGRGDQEIDRRVIEPAQPPFDRRQRPQIVGGGKADHGGKPGAVDRDRGDLRDIGMERGDDNQRRAAGDGKGDAEAMHDGIGDGLGAVVIPRDRLVHEAERESGMGQGDDGG